MTDSYKKFRALFLATLMVLSVVAGAGVAAAQSSGNDTTAGNDAGNDSASGNDAAAGNEAASQLASSTQTEASENWSGTVDEDSAKPLTISWYRADGEGNGPYPVLPNEYEDDTSGISMFANAEGDGHMRVDNTTAQNPAGNWDMVAVHVETSGLEDLNPPAEGAEKGLVTQNFLEHENWDMTIQQKNGDKTLNVSQNQMGYEQPSFEANTSADVPPVMVFADTEEIEGDWSAGDDPDSGLYVWIDPNRATLTNGDGEEASFQPGEEYTAMFGIHGQTEATGFEMVEGNGTLDQDLAPGNRFTSTLNATSTLAAGTEVQMEVEFETGEVQTQTVEVEGNEILGGDSAGTNPIGYAPATFNMSNREGQSFDVRLYAPGTARDDDNYLNETNRQLVAESSGEVQDIIDPNYTIQNASVTEGKPLGLAYGISDYSTPAEIANSVGDGEVAQDDSLAYLPQGAEAWDTMWLHYETSPSVFEAIRKSPGANSNQKLESSPLSLELVQTNADGEPKRLNITRNDSGVLTIQDPDTADSRLYNNKSQGLFVHLNPNEMVLYQGGEPVEMETGEEYNATLTIETEEGTETESITFSTIEDNTQFRSQGDTVELRQGSEVDLTVVTQRAAGAELGIAAESQSADANFSVSEEGLVPEGTGSAMAGGLAGSMPNATYGITIDTSDLPVGTTLDLSTYISEDAPDTPLPVVNTTAEIVPPPTGSISVSDQSGDGSSVTIDEINTSDGGFVSVHTGRAQGPTIGTSGFIESGVQENVEVELDETVSEDTELFVVLHRDSNNNQEYEFPAADNPYESNGSPVTASTQYTVEGSSTPTDTEGGEETTEPPSVYTDSTETTAEDGPGFGLVATLIAIVASGFLLRRRD